MKQTFCKEERLSEEKLIDQLFKEGKSFFQFPFKVVFLPMEDAVPYHAKILISVPKRNFKKAVDRNHIKRLIREAYRKNKFILDKGNKDQLYLIGFIYTTARQLTYQEIEKKIILVLQQLKQEHE